MKTKDPRKNAILTKTVTQASTSGVIATEQKEAYSKPSKKTSSLDDETKPTKSNKKQGLIDTTIDTNENKMTQQQNTFAEDQLDLQK